MSILGSKCGCWDSSVHPWISGGYWYLVWIKGFQWESMDYSVDPGVKVWMLAFQCETCDCSVEPGTPVLILVFHCRARWILGFQCACWGFPVRNFDIVVGILEFQYWAMDFSVNFKTQVLILGLQWGFFFHSCVDAIPVGILTLCILELQCGS